MKKEISDGIIDWQPMSTAPQNGEWIQVKIWNEKIYLAHFAEDLSGEDQPPFSGWFTNCGRDYSSVGEPLGWQPLSEQDIQDMERHKREQKAEEEKRRKAGIHSCF